MAYGAWVSGSVLIETMSGFVRRERLVEIGEARRLRRAPPAARVVDVARADADHLEAVDPRIGEGMGHAHVAEPDDENPLCAHRTLPAQLLFPPIQVCLTCSLSSRSTRLAR